MMNQTQVLLKRSEVKFHQSLCCTYHQMLQDNETESFSLESESYFPGGDLRAGKSLSLALCPVPSDCSQRWPFPSVLTTVVQVHSSGKIPATAAIFKASVVHSALLFAPVCSSHRALWVPHQPALYPLLSLPSFALMQSKVL